MTTQPDAVEPQTKACLLCNGTGEHRWLTLGERATNVEPCPRCDATGIDPTSPTNP